MKEAGQERLEERVFVFKHGEVANGLCCKSAWRVAIRRIRCARHRSAIAHEHGARLIVDNVFATPILQKPLALGADCVVYSATKHIDGHGRCLGGIILGGRDLIENEIHPFYKQTGPCLSPFNAWVFLKSLETLALRVRQQAQNAERIAEFLSGHRHVFNVRYPGRADHPQAELVKRQMSGGGTLVSFEVRGGK
jgi:O-succinylhomoserine sulfhydrylase